MTMVEDAELQRTLYVPRFLHLKRLVLKEAAPHRHIGLRSRLQTHTRGAAGGLCQTEDEVVAAPTAAGTFKGSNGNLCMRHGFVMTVGGRKSEGSAYRRLNVY